MVVIFLGELVLFAVIGALVSAPSASLSKLFAQQGYSKGQNVLYMIAVVVNPQAETQLANGTRTVEWQAIGFHIAVLLRAMNALASPHKAGLRRW